MKADEGIPWAAPKAARSDTLYRDIEIGDGDRGFAYCYSLLVGNGNAGHLHIPDYRKKKFQTRIDGELISGEAEDDTAAANRPRSFFQGDKYYYRRFEFGLN
jgi:hypothetical protein